MRTQSQGCSLSSIRTTGGFSLLEAIATLVIISVSVVCGIPSFKSLQAHQQTVALTNQLLNYIANTRNTAITHRRATLICPTRGDEKCRSDADWSVGWMMFHDSDGNRRPEHTEDVIGVEVIRKSDFNIYSTGGRPLLRYNSTGQAGGSNLTLTICHEGKPVKLIRVNTSGRARTDMPGAQATCGA